MIPRRRYTKAELQKFITPEVSQKLQLRGMVLRLDGDGMYSIVPYTESAIRGGVALEDDMALGVFNKPDPIRKRTPQERLDSLAARIGLEVKATGGLPGVQENMVGEEVSALAGEFLRTSEAKFEESEGRKTVRTAPSD